MDGDRIRMKETTWWNFAGHLKDVWIYSPVCNRLIIFQFFFYSCCILRPNLKVLNSPLFHIKFFSLAPSEAAFVLHDRLSVKLCALRKTVYLTPLLTAGFYMANNRSI